MKELILGGVRSGKSRTAEARARAGGRDVVYIATMRESDDEEMCARIVRHRAQRPAGWTVVEEPVALAAALGAHDGHGRCLLVECLTLWLTNLLCAGDEAQFARERAALIELWPRLQADVIAVGNETGLGIVPMNALARRFGDEAGLLHQDLARLCDRVTLVAAGLPLTLKGNPP
jgi:adenosylcobinamide kinase/adenosylcobinamide-phosphate guanylyltransferase